MSSPQFPAKFYSQCPGCDETIAPDDLVGFNDGDDKVSCENCYVDTFVPDPNYYRN